MLLELKQKLRKNLLNQLNQFENNEIGIEEIDIEELRRKIKDLADEKKSIELILQSNPELANNIDFMREALEVDLTLIIYDRTNNLDLYLEVLDRMKNSDALRTDFEKRGKKYNIGFEELIAKIQEELQSPKHVDSDKYKIPTKYLFEAIRNGFTVGKEMFVYNNINAYFKQNGAIPRTTGEYIQRLFESDDSYILRHEIHHSNEEENNETANRICFEGLKSSRHDQGCINNLVRTTVGNYRKEITLFEFLPWPDDRNDQILISIPKKMIDNSEPIWGADFSEITEGVDSYILPQYIIGYIDKNGEFCSNPVNIQDRKRYHYLFRNRETVAYNKESKSEMQH